jgi:hypothetical protein
MMNDFLVEISPLLQALLVTVLTVVLPLGLRYLHTYLAVKQAELEARIPERQLQLVKTLVSDFVVAAEQNRVNGYLEKLGKSKLDYVMDQMQSELWLRGIQLDVATLRGLVEAAVRREFGKPELPATDSAVG